MVGPTIETLELKEQGKYLVEKYWIFGGWIINIVIGTMNIVYGTMSIIGGTMSNGHEVVEPYKEPWIKSMEPWEF